MDGADDLAADALQVDAGDAEVGVSELALNDHERHSLVASHTSEWAPRSGDDTAADRLFRDATERDERAGAPAWVSRDLRHHSDHLRSLGQDLQADEIAARIHDSGSDGTA